MQNNRSNTGKTGNRDRNSDAADKRRQEQTNPAEHDDPTSAQDDPDLPAQDALIPSQADLENKESVEYFTPSGELPDPETAGEMEPDEEDASPEIIMGTEADVTAEDLANLGPRDEDMDEGEDESVRARDLLVKQTDEESDEEPPEELDVPGAAADDDAESRGMEDEENNEYSLGGDKD
ncbi:hypothetical protein [uncultured Chitinophaga sp.]|jgi:hypothetical protein|uniref:hypothetical protein n=1 Tax=uncultured Chitinophaga sp. TaxID=339340 RepID=UPI002619D2C5|nr:hypothetical protein [uncultured Chitinophaga sp.]